MNTTTNNDSGLPDQMDLTTAIDLLTRHNNWRRGGDGEMVDVTRLGIALDSAIAHLNMLQQVRLPWIIEGLDEIGGLSRHLRHGGPAPEDLNGLNEGLSHAIDLATELRDELAALPDAGMKPTTLWCLHMVGPDDVYPAPSKEHAEMAENAYSAMLAERPFNHGVTCKAVVAPWPHSAASHAEGVGSFITDHLVPAWQTEAETASRGLMQLIQKASFSSAVDKQFALELASIMVPAPARPAAPGIDDTAMLNWMDANGFTAYRQIDPIDGLSRHCVVVAEAVAPRHGNVHDTIRGAIRAAMQAAGAEVKP